MPRQHLLRLAPWALLLGAAPLHPADLPVDAEAAPGTVVRWSGPGLTSCELAGKRWQPFKDACWYPIDLDAKGVLEIVRRSSGGVASRRVKVADYPYPVQRLTVEEKYVAPPPEALERIREERARTSRVLGLRTPRRFELPLASPLASLPTGGRFGSRRIFNGEPRNPHTGADYAATTGTVVRAVADGTVALSEDQYFAGNAVYIDHGDGLVSMSFHLSERLVADGDEVARGQPIGKVGATGRVTGPHLHFGLHWRGARIDPDRLLAKLAVVDVR